MFVISHIRRCFSADGFDSVPKQMWRRIRFVRDFLEIIIGFTIPPRWMMMMIFAHLGPMSRNCELSHSLYVIPIWNRLWSQWSIYICLIIYGSLISWRALVDPLHPYKWPYLGTPPPSTPDVVIFLLLMNLYVENRVSICLECNLHVQLSPKELHKVLMPELLPPRKDPFPGVHVQFGENMDQEWIFPSPQ